MHAFATETQLTHDEWREGIAFLHRAAEISSPSRSEFTLMSDVLGLSSLVDLLAARPSATEGSVLGPFHTRGSPWMDNGANLIRDNAGEAVLIRGRVTDIHGQTFGDGPGDTITIIPAAVTLSTGDRYPVADLVLLRRAEQ